MSYVLKLSFFNRAVHAVYSSGTVDTSVVGSGRLRLDGVRVREEPTEDR